MRRVPLSAAIEESGTRRGATLLLDGARIAGLETGEGGDLVALPPPANAHDHARPVRSSSFGNGGRPLETWLHRLALLPAVDPYLAAAVSLGRSALGGAGAVMVHYTRAYGPMPLPDEAAEVARAARDVGVRIGFATAMRDRNPLVYGDHAPVLAALPAAQREAVAARLLRPPLPPAEQVALADAVAARIAGPTVDAQYGPAAPQWCSDTLLRAVAEASAVSGRRVHMHLLETRYQRDWADREHPDGIVLHLDRLGLLSPRLTLAHCTWARPAELDLLAERGVTIAVNTGSNLGLRSGIAPVAEMVRRGCRVAMGLDGLAFDEDDDALSELRLAWALHRGWGFEEAVSRARMLRIALVEGHRAVTNQEDGGTLAPGTAADVLLLDARALDADTLWPGVDPLDLLLCRGAAPQIRELIVAGRTVVCDGALVGIDHPALRTELLARFRAGLADDSFAAVLPAFERAVAEHFGSAAAGCC